MADNSPLTVIAEAGVNHNGDRGQALAMVQAAAEAGADVVKFQAFRAQTLVSDAAQAAAYQRRNAATDRQRDLLGPLELRLDDFAIIAKACAKAGIEFMATPFEVEFLGPLVSFGMSRIKVASGEITNFPALHRFAAERLPVLLSSGMSTLQEVVAAVDTLVAAGLPKSKITVLHCTSLYPAPIAAVNLRAMAAIRESTGCEVGYSDHTLGDHVSIAAVALGATVIEKHFTLDRGLPGPDHRASLEPDELATMVRRLRETAIALGDGVKRPHPDEMDTLRLVRRSWHARRDLLPNVPLTRDDVILKRPLGGASPTLDPVGWRLKRAVAADHPVRDLDLEN